MCTRVAGSSELQLAICQTREAVGMTWIQADGLAQLTSGLLVAVQDEQVEAQLLVPAGVLGT